MKILLDTHIFLWLIHKNKFLSKEVIEVINNPKNDIFFSKPYLLGIETVGTK